MEEFLKKKSYMYMKKILSWSLLTVRQMLCWKTENRFPIIPCMYVALNRRLISKCVLTWMTIYKLPFNHFDWFRTLGFRNRKILFQRSLLIKIFKIKWTRLMRYFFAIFPMGEIVVVVLSPWGLMHEWLVRPCNMIDGFLPRDILAYVLSCYDFLKTY
jgi:hypothetical protein